jgi:addiction module HigA family antidote
LRERNADTVQIVDYDWRSTMSQIAVQPVHPGAVLKEELERRRLSANALALKLRVPPQRIQEIVAGRRSITPETALRLQASLGTPAGHWMTMQVAYDLHQAEARFGEAVRAEVIAVVGSRPPRAPPADGPNSGGTLGQIDADRHQCEAQPAPRRNLEPDRAEQAEMVDRRSRDQLAD